MTDDMKQDEEEKSIVDDATCEIPVVNSENVSRYLKHEEKAPKDTSKHNVKQSIPKVKIFATALGVCLFGVSSGLIWSYVNHGVEGNTRGTELTTASEQSPLASKADSSLTKTVQKKSVKTTSFVRNDGSTLFYQIPDVEVEPSTSQILSTTITTQTTKTHEETSRVTTNTHHTTTTHQETKRTREGETSTRWEATTSKETLQPTNTTKATREPELSTTIEVTTTPQPTTQPTTQIQTHPTKETQKTTEPERSQESETLE